MRGCGRVESGRQDGRGLVGFGSRPGNGAEREEDGSPAEAGEYPEGEENQGLGELLGRGHGASARPSKPIETTPESGKGSEKPGCVPFGEARAKFVILVQLRGLVVGNIVDGRRIDCGVGGWGTNVGGVL
jgi:hypothetical protein